MHATFDARFLAAALIVTALAGCGPDAFLHKPEKELGVEYTWYGTDLRVWHSALFKPRGEGLRSPGYVLGIEKVHPATTIPPSLNGTPLPRDAGLRITHVVRYDQIDATETSPPVNTSCVLFSMIDRERQAAEVGKPAENSAHYVFDLCKPKSDETTGAIRSGPPADPKLDAIAALDSDLTARLKRDDFTDVIVMVMGWNTDQQEALNNFSALTGHMVDEARRHHVDFRPLVIGVSWPSEWQLDDWFLVPDPVVRLASFPFKAIESDDVGTQIIGGVLDAILKVRHAAKKPPRVVLIGHSFGARALVQAIKQTAVGGSETFDDRDRMILFEGAFEIYSLFTDADDKFADDDGNLDAHFASGRPRVTLTSSYYDSAVAAAIWGRYAGDAVTFDDVCRENSQVWKPPLRHQLTVSQIGCDFPGSDERNTQFGLRNCGPKSDSSYHPGPPNRGLADRPLPEGSTDKGVSKPVRYFDASYMINCNEPFTGGGAHSDIFRDETARFLLHEIIE